MSRLTTSAIADAILAAPGWARVGISAPRPFLREDAAEELARLILAGTEGADEGRAEEVGPTLLL